MAGDIHIGPHLLRPEHEQEVGGLENNAGDPRATDRVDSATQIFPRSGDSFAYPHQKVIGVTRVSLCKSWIWHDLTDLPAHHDWGPSAELRFLEIS